MKTSFSVHYFRKHMAMWKTISVLYLVLLIIMVFEVITIKMEDIITYEAMAVNNAWGCSPKYPQFCYKTQANPYTPKGWLFEIIMEKEFGVYIISKRLQERNQQRVLRRKMETIYVWFYLEIRFYLTLFYMCVCVLLIFFKMKKKKILVNK